MTYDIDIKTGALLGDDVLERLARVGFMVKLYTFEGDSNAGLEDVKGQGMVPDPDLMRAFADKQPLYAKELRLRQPLLNKGKRKGR